MAAPTNREHARILVGKYGMRNYKRARMDHTVLLTGAGRSDIEQLWRDGTFSDVEVHVAGKTFSAHRVVLAATSAVLKSALCIGMAETAESSITLKEIDAATFEICLEFMYTGKVSVKQTVLHSILEAADRLQMTQLLEKTEEAIVNGLTLTTSLSALALGELHSRPKIVDAALAMVKENFINLTHHLRSEFVTLSADMLDELLKSDHLGVACEKDVVLVLLRWLDAQKKTPAMEIEERLLSRIRWARLELAFLREHLNPHPVMLRHAMAMATLFQQALFEPKPPRRISERELTRCIEKMRSDYTQCLHPPNASREAQQRGVAVYLVDRLALRLGCKWGDAACAGACTLRVADVKLEDPFLLRVTCECLAAATILRPH